MYEPWFPSDRVLVILGNIVTVVVMSVGILCIACTVLLKLRIYGGLEALPKLSSLSTQDESVFS